MGVTGQYVATFAEATHALPAGMHMNADYPFMHPKVARVVDGYVVLVSNRGDEEACRIVVDAAGVETCSLKQSSMYERIFGRQPTKFVFHPFKGEQW